MSEKPKTITEEEMVEEIVDPEMLQFATRFNAALGKMKAAVETDTNCLLLNDEAGALLDYIKAVMLEMQRQERS